MLDDASVYTCYLQNPSETISHLKTLEDVVGRNLSKEEQKKFWDKVYNDWYDVAVYIRNQRNAVLNG